MGLQLIIDIAAKWDITTQQKAVIRVELLPQVSRLLSQLTQLGMEEVNEDLQ